MDLSPNMFVIWQSPGEYITGTLNNIQEKEDKGGWYANITPESNPAEQYKLSLVSQKQVDYYKQYIGKLCYAECQNLDPLFVRFMSMDEHLRQNNNKKNSIRKDYTHQHHKTRIQHKDTVPIMGSKDNISIEWLNAKEKEYEYLLQIIRAYKENIKDGDHV